jgi:hypothetical protein
MQGEYVEREDMPSVFPNVGVEVCLGVPISKRDGPQPVDSGLEYLRLTRVDSSVSCNLPERSMPTRRGGVSPARDLECSLIRNALGTTSAGVNNIAHRQDESSYAAPRISRPMAWLASFSSSASSRSALPLTCSDSMEAPMKFSTRSPAKTGAATTVMPRRYCPSSTA